MPLDLEKLRALAAGKNQATIARAAKLSQGRVSQILSGDWTDLPISTLERLAKAVGVSPRKLIRE
jgi:transcriptional regulator with XRE-family HTH domain